MNHGTTSSSSSSAPNNKRINVYILLLEENKYYVGRATNVSQRVSQHEIGAGSEWTKKFPVIRIKKIVFHKKPWAEDYYVVKLMRKHGIDNVRGGSFSMIHLSNETKAVIQSMMRTLCDACFVCGQTSHFARECPKNSESSSSSSSSHNRETSSIVSPPKKEIVDWTCQFCRVTNFADRSHCRSCSVRKTMPSQNAISSHIGVNTYSYSTSSSSPSTGNTPLSISPPNRS
jgi:hypothetical protein